MHLTPSPRPLALPVLALLVACSGDKDTAVIPSTLVPLEDTIPACPGGGSAFPEEVTVSSTREDDFFSAQSCGYVTAALDDVAGAVHTPEVGIDRRVVNVDDCTITEDVDPEFDVSYDVDTIVHDLVDVQYTLAWRHDLDVDGRWLTRWQMTTDNPYVLSIEGSVVTAVAGEDPTGATVRVEVAEHIDALVDSQEEQITEFLADFHASIVAVAHGDPLPDFQ